MSKYLLDSSAILAVVYEEPGADVVESLFHLAAISSVNLCEAISVMALDDIPADNALSVLIDMVPNVIPFDLDIALIASRMITDTRPLGLSLGDRACLATAEHLHLEAVTADKIWAKIKRPTKIKVIR